MRNGTRMWNNCAARNVCRQSNLNTIISWTPMGSSSRIPSTTVVESVPKTTGRHVGSFGIDVIYHWDWRVLPLEISTPIPDDVHLEVIFGAIFVGMALPRSVRMGQDHSNLALQTNSWGNHSHWRRIHQRKHVEFARLGGGYLLRVMRATRMEKLTFVVGFASTIKSLT